MDIPDQPTQVQLSRILNSEETLNVTDRCRLMAELNVRRAADLTKASIVFGQQTKTEPSDANIRVLKGMVYLTQKEAEFRRNLARGYLAVANGEAL